MAEAPRELVSMIDKHIEGFNDQNVELFLGVFGDTAIIIDGTAPYRWLNPNAPANWLVDVEKWRENLGVSYEHLAYEMGFWTVEGPHAYDVVTGTLTVTIKPLPGRVLSHTHFPSTARSGRSTHRHGAARPEYSTASAVSLSFGLFLSGHDRDGGVGVRSARPFFV